MSPTRTLSIAPLSTAPLSVSSPTASAPGATLRVLVAVVLCALAWVVVATGAPAYAHAGLVSSDPRDGSTLDTAPEQATLEFSEPIRTPAYVVVTGPDGTTHQLDDAVIDEATVSQALDPETVATARLTGGWTVAYRVVSEDGHPIQGHVRFRISGQASDSPTGSPTGASMATSPSEQPSTDTSTADSSQESGTSTSTGVWALGLAALAVVAVLAAARARRRA